MKNLIIGFIIGFILGSALVVKATGISLEPLFNRVFNSTNNSLNVEII